MNNIFETEVCVGSIRCKLRYTTKEELDFIEETFKELNEKFNKLLISCGRVDEKLLLFTFLLEIQYEITVLQGCVKDFSFSDTLKEIKNFIGQQQRLEEQIMVGILIKKNELTNLQRVSKISNSYRPDLDFYPMLEDFTQRILANISSIANNIL